MWLLGLIYITMLLDSQYSAGTVFTAHVIWEYVNFSNIFYQPYYLLSYSFLPVVNVVGCILIIRIIKNAKINLIKNFIIILLHLFIYSPIKIHFLYLYNYIISLRIHSLRIYFKLITHPSNIIDLITFFT